MYSDSLFEKNLQAFRKVRPNLSPSEFSPERALEKRNSCSIDEELKLFEQQEKKAYQLPWYLPRDVKYVERLQADYAHFKIPGEISQYTDLPDKDPHLVKTLLDLRELIKELGIDPSDNITSPTKVSSFIAFGTGNGLFIEQVVEKFQPKNLIVAVTHWDDLLSSFWYVDWGEYTSFLAQQGRSISMLRAKSKEDVRSILAAQGLLAAEHCLIYKSMSAEPAVHVIADELHGQSLHNIINYLGFQLDEYNMLLNTHRTLKTCPKVFTQPNKSLGLQKVIVCGSGPSLDLCIDTIKYLANSHVIIASGSNYHALRRSGVEVDYLVLVERANNTYDDYRESVDMYGSGNTTLVMSSTCPAELSDLFQETIIFFRPALTPLAIYSDNVSEVLNFEGPESLNGGFAWACALRPQKIILMGADLGTVSQQKLRSMFANGVSPRTFDIEVDGNLSESAFTSSFLLDSREVIESCIQYYHQDVINCSDGILIKGAEPMPHFVYKDLVESKVSEKCNKNPDPYINWKKSLKSYDKHRLDSLFIARSPRESVYRTCNELRQLFDARGQCWVYDIIPQLDKILDINQNIRFQFCARIIRGTIYKVFLAMLQQSYINHKYKIDIQEQYVLKASQLMIDLIDTMEIELYSLCDAIEP